VADVQGFTADKFEGLRGVLSDQLDSGLDLGASVAVHLGGEVVCDIWGGFADPAKTTPWDRDTIVNVWSTTKTMTFLVALMLADRGELDFDATVATYWPEFAANGKEGVLVRNLMGHTAGLSGWVEPLAVEDLADWERCTSALAAQAPWWEPGTASGYHAVTQGYLIGEVVRRITGVTIGEFFRTEVAEPLGADFHIGVPEAAEHRVSVVVPPPPLSLEGMDPSSIPARTFASPPVTGALPAERWWRACEIPAANGHGNARSVALVQSIVANGGEANGIRFVRRSTLDRIFEVQADGEDLVLRVPLRFGMGYGLGSDLMALPPHACFWGGYGGSVVIMDLDQQFTVSYAMNLMAPELLGDTRGANIALTAAVAAAG
jgi:CubicO group peptidase (beta-lactamase class C family)